MWKIVEIRKSQFFNFFPLKCEKTHKKHLKTWKGNNLVKKRIGPVEKILVKKIGPQRVKVYQNYVLLVCGGQHSDSLLS